MSLRQSNQLICNSLSSFHLERKSDFLCDLRSNNLAILESESRIARLILCLSGVLSDPNNFMLRPSCSSLAWPEHTHTGQRTLLPHPTIRDTIGKSLPNRSHEAITINSIIHRYSPGGGSCFSQPTTAKDCCRKAANGQSA